MVLDELDDLIDKLAASTPAPDAHGERLLRLNRALARLEAITAAEALAFEESGAYALSGARSAASWLARRARLPESSARRQLRLGRVIKQCPHAGEEWRRGELNSAHVALLGALARGRTAEAFGESEELLVSKARLLHFEDFQRCCHYFEQLADPDGSDDRSEERRARRDVVLSQSIGRMWFGRMTLDEISGEIIAGELDRLEEELYELDKNEATARLGRDPHQLDLRRTASQRRADALVEMARRSGAAPDGAPRPAPLFTVLVGYETLHGRILQLASGAVLSPGSLLPWLNDAVIERAVFGPNARVEIGARRRLFDGATRRAIEVRDQRCAHPSCTLPASRCQVDHVVPYESGGLTTQENGRLLCGFHNRLAYAEWRALDERSKSELVAAQEAAYRAGQHGRDAGEAEAYPDSVGRRAHDNDGDESDLTDGHGPGLTDRGPPPA